MRSIVGSVSSFFFFYFSVNSTFCMKNTHHTVVHHPPAAPPPPAITQQTTKINEKKNSIYQSRPPGWLREEERERESRENGNFSLSSDVWLLQPVAHECNALPFPFEWNGNRIATTQDYILVQHVPFVRR